MIQLTATRTFAEPTRRRAPAVRPGRKTKYDPGPQATITYFATGLLVPLETCPRCGNPTEQEPAFVHCRICGRLWPVANACLNQQRVWEQSSGLETGEADPIRQRGYHSGPLPTGP